MAPQGRPLTPRLTTVGHAVIRGACVLQHDNQRRSTATPYLPLKEPSLANFRRDTKGSHATNPSSTRANCGEHVAHLL